MSRGDAAEVEAAREGVTRRQLLRGAGAAVAVSAGVAGTASIAMHGTNQERARATAAANDLSGRTSTRVLWRADTDELVIALTFDDGPVERYTRPLLDVLEEERCPAAFCVVGERALAQRELIAREVSGRHELVNHSWTHADLGLAETDEVRREVGRTDQLLEDLTGTAPRLLRPPYGRLSGATLEIAAESGHDVLLWDNRFREKGQTAQDNVDRVLDELRPGMVLLGHDGGPGPHEVGLAAVGPIIRGARARGYRFVTATEMFSLDRSSASG